MTLKTICNLIKEVREKIDENYCRDHKCCQFDNRFECPLYCEDFPGCSYYALTEAINGIYEIVDKAVVLKYLTSETDEEEY